MDRQLLHHEKTLRVRLSAVFAASVIEAAEQEMLSASAFTRRCLRDGIARLHDQKGSMPTVEGRL